MSTMKAIQCLYDLISMLCSAAVNFFLNVLYILLL